MGSSAGDRPASRAGSGSRRAGDAATVGLGRHRTIAMRVLPSTSPDGSADERRSGATFGGTGTSMLGPNATSAPGAPVPRHAPNPARRPAAARRLTAGLSLIGCLLAILGPGAAIVQAADGPTMTARVLLQGHARPGSWIAIEVHLVNSGPSISGELRLQGGSQGGTRYATAVQLDSPSDKTWILHAQPPSFGQQLEVALVSGGQ